LKTYKIIILKKKSNLLKIVYIAKQSASATYAPPPAGETFFFKNKTNCFNILIAIQWNLFYSHISCNGRDKPRKLNAETRCIFYCSSLANKSANFENSVSRTLSLPFGGGGRSSTKRYQNCCYKIESY